MEGLLTVYGGNASAAALELDVDRRVLLVAIDVLNVRAWMEDTWPDRARGGAPRR